MPIKNGLMLLVMMLLGACPAMALGQCQQLTRVASVEMKPMPDGRMLVPVTVDGHLEYFLLSTAVPLSSISQALADQLKLPLRHSNIRFVNFAGHESTTLATAHSFALGRLEAQSVTFLVGSGHNTNATPTPNAPSGTLGADFLRAYDVDLDFGTDRMNLFSRDHCAGAVVYWKSATLAMLPMIVRDDGKISFIMNLDGHDLQTVLDTGLARSALSMRVAAVTYGLDNDSAGNSAAGKLAGETTLYAHPFKTLSVDGVTISNPRIVLMPNLADDELGPGLGRRAALFRPAHAQQPDFSLGMAELRHLHIYIDYQDQTVYLSPGGGGAPAAATP